MSVTQTRIMSVRRHVQRCLRQVRDMNNAAGKKQVFAEFCDKTDPRNGAVALVDGFSIVAGGSELVASLRFITEPADRDWMPRAPADKLKIIEPQPVPGNDSVARLVLSNGAVCVVDLRLL